MSFMHRHIHELGLSLILGIDHCTILDFILKLYTIIGQDKTKGR